MKQPPPYDFYEWEEENVRTKVGSHREAALLYWAYIKEHVDELEEMLGDPKLKGASQVADQINLCSIRLNAAVKNAAHAVEGYKGYGEDPLVEEDEQGD